MILIIYYIVLKKVFKYKPNPNVHLYGEQQLEKINNHNAYIRTIKRQADKQLLTKKETGSDTEDNEPQNNVNSKESGKDE